MDQLHQGALSPNAGIPLDGPLSDIPTSPGEHGQVNIAEAKAAFAELERRLSTTAHNSGNGVSIVDPEKGEPDHFDLREYMQSTNDANTANGISHKHVGVTWTGLSVVVTGFESQKVRHLRTRCERHPLWATLIRSRSLSLRSEKQSCNSFCFPTSGLWGCGMLSTRREKAVHERFSKSNRSVLLTV